MAKRLIDANALRREYCKACSPDVRESCKTDPLCASMTWIVEAPGVDAVAVVRCRDCKHYVPPDDGDFLGVCKNGKLAVSQSGEIYPEENFYCSYGERRTNE